MQFGKMLMDELTHLVKTNQMIMINNEKSAQTNNNAIHDKYPLFRTLSNLSINFNKKPDQSTIGEIEPPPSKKSKKQGQESNDLNENLNKQDLVKQNYLQLAEILKINETHMKPINWKYLYSKEDVDLCLSKIKLIDFNERIDVYGSVIVQAKSSGYSIGSCNWSIESDCDNILYLSKSSLLGNHSKQFDISFLKQQIIDCLIISGFNQAPNCDPELNVIEFCKACVYTIKNQGNVLVPVLPTGKIYDLIEYLYRHLAENNLTNTPVYFISQTANQSLAYSNIFAEWLCESRQNFVYAAEYPFNHGELLKTGLIKIYPSITSKFNEDFHQPCIIFASHTSLRFGDACHFIEFWKNSPNNAFIFTEPDFNPDFLTPYQPIYAAIYHFPIDTSLNINQFYKLIRETKQLNQLIVSNHCKLNDQQMIDTNKLNQSTKFNYYSQNDIIKIALKRKYENCDIEADLALMIMPTKKNINNLNSVPSKTLYSTFNAQLVTKNNHHILKAAPRTIPLTRRDRLNESNLRKYAYGKLNLEKFLNALRQNGLNSFKLAEKDNSKKEIVNDYSSDPLFNLNIAAIDNDTILVNEKNLQTTNKTDEPNYIIEFDSFNRILVDLNTNQINIVSDNEDLRVKIKDSLFKCIKTL
jgi:integrator complex subunit 9